jgi:hypothetical protein
MKFKGPWLHQRSSHKSPDWFKQIALRHPLRSGLQEQGSKGNEEQLQMIVLSATATATLTNTY